MRSDAEAQLARYTDRVRQRHLQRGFAAATALEKRQNLRPRNFRLCFQRNQVRIVAIAAGAGAALAKHGCHQLARLVARRQPGHSADPQLNRAQRALRRRICAHCAPIEACDASPGASRPSVLNCVGAFEIERKVSRDLAAADVAAAGAAVCSLASCDMTVVTVLRVSAADSPSLSRMSAFPRALGQSSARPLPA
jgi:hypothetical protein